VAEDVNQPIVVDGDSLLFEVYASVWCYFLPSAWVWLVWFESVCLMYPRLNPYLVRTLEALPSHPLLFFLALCLLNLVHTQAVAHPRIDWSHGGQPLAINFLVEYDVL
jgi:hypothetical protein